MKDLTKAAQTKAAAKKVHATKTAPVTLHSFTYPQIQEAAAPGAKEKAKAAFTMAALILSGLAAVTQAGRVTPPAKSTKPNLDLFKEYTRNGKSTTAYKKFTGHLPTAKHGALVDAKGITPEGIKFLQSRLNGEGPAFNTEKEIIQPLREAMKTGKALKQIAGVTVRDIKPTTRTVEVAK